MCLQELVLGSCSIVLHPLLYFVITMLCYLSTIGLVCYFPYLFLQVSLLLHIFGQYIIVVWFILFYSPFFGAFAYYSPASTPISPSFVFCVEGREMVVRFFFEVSFPCPFSLLLCYNLVEAAHPCLEFLSNLTLVLEKYIFLFVHSECVSIAMFNGGWW